MAHSALLTLVVEIQLPIFCHLSFSLQARYPSEVIPRGIYNFVIEEVSQKVASRFLLR